MDSYVFASNDAYREIIKTYSFPESYISCYNFYWHIFNPGNSIKFGSGRIDLSKKHFTFFILFLIFYFLLHYILFL